MPNPGDVVLADVAGAVTAKRRPVVVISSATYLSERPDLTTSLLTTNVAAAKTSTDYVLKDWAVAGLKMPTAFRVFINMVSPADAQYIGRLSPRDWAEVKRRLARAIG